MYLATTLFLQLYDADPRFNHQMVRRFSKSHADRIGERIRRSEGLSSQDLALLQEVIAEYDSPMQKVEEELVRLEMRPTSRLKTEDTTIEKLRRERTRLSTIQDLAGIRVVGDWDLDEQDEVVEAIASAFEKARLDDRRERPSHGYRAVHVIVEVDGFPVEIQVRTLFQDAWAQLMEHLADRAGRGIRYGDRPADAAAEELVDTLLRMSEKMALVEQGRRGLFRSRPDLPPPPPSTAPVEVLTAYAELKQAYQRSDEALRKIRQLESEVMELTQDALKSIDNEDFK